MRPAQVSNENLLAAVKAVLRAKPSFEQAEAAYLKLGNQENRDRYEAAKRELDAAREQRNRAGKWIP